MHPALVLPYLPTHPCFQLCQSSFPWLDIPKFNRKIKMWRRVQTGRRAESHSLQKALKLCSKASIYSTFYLKRRGRTGLINTKSPSHKQSIPSTTSGDPSSHVRRIRLYRIIVCIYAGFILLCTLPFTLVSGLTTPKGNALPLKYFESFEYPSRFARLCFLFLDY